VLLAARAVQGLGVAAIASAAFATIGASRRTSTRAWTMALLTAGASLAFGAGPLLGGATAAIAGWRATFLLPLIGVGVSIALARKVGPAADPHGSIDWTGAALLACAATCALTAVQSPQTHLSLPVALSLTLAALLSALGLARRTRRRPGGFLSASYLRTHRTRREIVSAATLGTGNLAMAFLAPLLITRVHPDWSPLQIGAVLFPGAAIPIGAALITRSMSRGATAVRALRALGGIAAAGMALAGLVPGVAWVAIGTGAATAGFAGAQVILFSRIPGLIAPREVGVTLGIVSLFAILGGAVGAATAGACVDLLGIRWATVAAAALPAMTIVVLGPTRTASGAR
jgi:predicted MFS family arabinose efflux permease